MVKLLNIKCNAKSALMKLFGEFIRIRCMNGFHLLFIWQFILKMANLYILHVIFVYENVQERVARPPTSILTALFQLLASDEFAITLLYSDVTHYYNWAIKKHGNGVKREHQLMAIQVFSMQKLWEDYIQFIQIW